ncbi:MAG: hypothetical protein N2712_05170 [Brevinematales bacterium]|nr:hypothetical protein [Brevinematales bacterium]
MNINYLLVSQLKISELYDYLEQHKKHFEIKSTGSVGFYFLYRLILSLGVEFWGFVVSIFLLSFIVDRVATIVGVLILLVFVSMYYFIIKRFIEFDITLRRIHSPMVKVVKNNKVCVVYESDVNIGDTVLVSKDDVVPFDLRVIESNSLVVDESKVFGEQRRVGKSAVTLPKKEFKIYELSNIIFSNSIIVKGSGKGIVINKSSPNNIFDYPAVQDRFNVKSTIFSMLLSVLVSLLILYVYKEFWVSLSIFWGVLYVISNRNFDIILNYIRYLITKKLYNDGVFLPSSSRISEINEIKKMIIKVDLSSFDFNKVSYYIVSKNKILSFDKVLYRQSELPQEILDTFLVVGTVYQKSKDVGIKVILNPIINDLTSLGLDTKTIRNYEIEDVSISNSLRELSTIRFRYNDVVFGILDLSSYVSEFGRIIGVNSGNGLVILRKEGSQSFYPYVLVLFREYSYSTNEIEQSNTRFYILTEMSLKDLDKLFGIVNVDTTKFSAIDFNDFLNAPDEQRKFFLEKFHIFYNIPKASFQDFARMFSDENESVMDSFVEISPKDIGLMKMPYFSLFFGKNNTILSSTRSIIIPFMLIKASKSTKMLIKKSRVLSIILNYLFGVVVLVGYLLGVFWVMVFIPLTLFFNLYLVSNYLLPKYSNGREG